jgi:hypothetical protein
MSFPLPEILNRLAMDFFVFCMMETAKAKQRDKRWQE